MGGCNKVTLEMIYEELKGIRKELGIVERAVMPVEKLSRKELEEHKQDLEEALKGEKTNFRYLKR
ncbi:hypothetical protein HY992_06385 [Candidatus Micrarchaeota archaeon]|nr:hypothetical protein [Candidatus Micrarchaeota archaeon]